MDRIDQFKSGCRLREGAQKCVPFFIEKPALMRVFDTLHFFPILAAEQRKCCVEPLRNTLDRKIGNR